MGWPKAGSTQFSGPSNRKHDDQRSIFLEHFGTYFQPNPNPANPLNPLSISTALEMGPTAYGARWGNIQLISEKLV